MPHGQIFKVDPRLLRLSLAANSYQSAANLIVSEVSEMHETCGIRICGLTEEPILASRDDLQMSDFDDSPDVEHAFFEGISVDVVAPRDAKLVAESVACALLARREAKVAESENRLVTIGRSLSAVFHDIRTPLAVIDGYAQHIFRSHGEETTGEMAKTIRKQVSHINQMIATTLGFARGERQLWVRELNMQAFVDEVVQQVQALVQGKNKKLIVENSFHGQVVFDPAKVMRALSNLLSNAAQVASVKTIRLSVGEEQDMLVFRVSDDGEGIADERIQSLFEPFGESTSRGGSGLGLAIVKAAVTEHRGEISVQSSKAGTTFRIQIPQDANSISRLLRDSVPPPEPAIY